MTMQVADDDASVAWELLARFGRCSALRAWSSATFVASSSWKASATAGLPGRGDREQRTTNVADHGHDLDGLAIGVLLIPIAESSPRRAEARRLRNDPAGAA
ncbi:MAG: hypothetical protein ACXVHL_32740 [Solirubrobacteraceae bacterium]